jgi:hypothetical protein
MSQECQQQLISNLDVGVDSDRDCLTRVVFEIWGDEVTGSTRTVGKDEEAAEEGLFGVSYRNKLIREAEQNTKPRFYAEHHSSRTAPVLSQCSGYRVQSKYCYRVDADNSADPYPHYPSSRTSDGAEASETTKGQDAEQAEGFRCRAGVLPPKNGLPPLANPVDDLKIRTLVWLDADGTPVRAEWRPLKGTKEDKSKHLRRHADEYLDCINERFLTRDDIKRKQYGTTVLWTFVKRLAIYQDTSLDEQ